MDCLDSTKSSSYPASSSYCSTTNNARVMGELFHYCHTHVRLMVNADKNDDLKKKLKRGLVIFSQGNFKAEGNMLNQCCPIFFSLKSK